MVRRSFIVLAALAVSSSAFADSLAWEVTGNNNFGKIDLNTGSFSPISNLNLPVAGLGEIGSTIYTATEGGMDLFAVNTNSGSTSLIGTSSISYYAFGSTNSGLFMVDTVGGLWNINPATGSSTLVGSTHLDMTTSPFVGMSAGSNTLYIALGSSVYSINTTTGAASFVGTSGTTDFGALVDVSGTVYGSSIINANEIYTFNPATGTSSFVTASNASDYAFGLAPIVPEPGSFALLALAGTVFGVYISTRKRVSSSLR